MVTYPLPQEFKIKSRKEPSPF
uniref:Uncharacterized protein n=1 Tax=Anguilla anguilla TaxID=7936 RepID=A0A0E9PIJ6_ANGAN